MRSNIQTIQEDYKWTIRKVIQGSLQAVLLRDIPDVAAQLFPARRRPPSPLLL